MIKTSIHSLFASFTLLILLVVPANAAPGSSMAVHGGDVVGNVQNCGTNLSRATVYVPGESYVAITDVDGNFTLRYVQPGSYQLIVEKDGAVLNTTSGVSVAKNKTTQVGTIGFCPDGDNDGYDESQDCNDQNPEIYPGAVEQCDGVDNNCDGQVDEDCPVCTDGDSDGFYAQAGCGSAVDCNDSESSINPVASETCFDSIDNNCNGQVDEDCLTCIPGSSCDTGSPGVCAGGVFNNSCSCVSVTPPSIEFCDSLDNDCNGVVDDSCQCSAGFTNCAGACVNTNSDVQHCGACGSACPGGSICVLGSCQDINECAPSPCGVGSCSESFGGGYTCSCPPGFNFNGTTCVPNP